MNRSKLQMFVQASLAVVLLWVPVVGRAQQKSLEELKDPSVAKGLIEQIIGTPKPIVETTTNFYADAVSSMDGFIPFNSLMTDHVTSKYYGKFTYENGRVVKCEEFDDTGKSSGYFAIWNDGSGAPVLSGHFNSDGTGDSYMYADYGDTGKIQTLYRFTKDFKMQRYERFSYDEHSTHIQRFFPDGKLEHETWYEGGQIFMTIEGKKTLVNTATREQFIRTPVKFGLKPIYPGY